MKKDKKRYTIKLIFLIKIYDNEQNGKRIRKIGKKMDVSHLSVRNIQKIVEDILVKLGFDPVKAIWDNDNQKC